MQFQAQAAALIRLADNSRLLCSPDWQTATGGLGGSVVPAMDAVHFVPLVAGRMQGQVVLGASRSASGLALQKVPAQQAAAMFGHAAPVFHRISVQ
jgi:hypothetical protein